METILTKREIEIVILIGQGLKNYQIAEKLSISLGTVKTHITSIFEKLEISYRVQAPLKALALGIIKLDEVV